MATLVRDDQGIRLILSAPERMFGLHGSLAFPASCIESIEPVDDPWLELRGIRWPGTGFPGVVMLGTLRFRGGRDFAAVYGRGPATIVTLRDAPFERVIVSGPMTDRSTVPVN